MTDLAESEYADLDETPGEIEETEDGGAIVRGRDEPDDDAEHFANLAGRGKFDAAWCKVKGQELCELIEKDKEAREKRDKQYEEGLKRTGFGDDAPGGAQFIGASKVVHPLIGEAGIDFQARVMKEIFPPDGPAKDKIVGEATRKKFERARRKVDWLNYQLTEQMVGFRSDLEQGIGQEPFGGAFYLQVVWGDEQRRPVQKVIFADEMILPFAATDFLTAERRTVIDRITSQTFERRVQSGMYREIEWSENDTVPEATRTEEANRKIEGKTENGFNEDGLRDTYIVFVSDDLEKEEKYRPYIVIVDAYMKDILSIQRNWEADDETCAEIEHIVEFPFIPWRGAYPLALTHLLGGLAGTATGAMRALLDAAFQQNSQTLLKRKGPSSRGGQSIQLQPNQVQEIEGSNMTDDIRKDLMPLPFNPPSPVLFQLLSFVVDAGRGVVRTTLDEVADTNKDVPVGTTLLRHQEGMVVFSSIFARQHASMGRFLRVMCRINRRHLTREMVMEAVGEPMVYPEDFDEPNDIVPVSDPNIFSEAQRFAQLQSIVQRADLRPDIYDTLAVEKAVLTGLKWPDPESLLRKQPAPSRMNAVNENLAATMGRPVMAFPEQEHLAHLQAHLDFMTSPMYGMSPLFAGALGVLLNHVRDHLALWYVSFVVEMVEEQSGVEVGKIMGKDETNGQRLDVLLAIASQDVLGMAPDVFERVPPVIKRAMEMVQAMMPDMPQDPAAASAQASMAETKRKQAADADKKQIEGAKIEKGAEEKAQERATKLAAEHVKQQAEDARTAAGLTVKREINTEDNKTALTIATMDNLADKRSEMETGTGGGPNPNP